MPGRLPDPTVDVPAVLAAADELRSAARRWAALVPGEELVVTWPEPAARRGGAGRSPGSAGTRTAARRRPPGRT